MKTALLALGLFALAGCASAQMQLPSQMVAGERLEFQGIGGWQSGRYTAAGYSGRYERSAETLTFLDADKATRGHSAFTLGETDLPPTEGECRMRERSLDLGIVEVTTRPMAYRCQFASEGRPLPAWLELQEFNGPGAAINRYERRGRLTFGAQELQIRSVHHLQGTSLPTSTPIGYVFEQNGRPVGALELNGRPVLILQPGASSELRRALVTGALALGVFWDPANLDT